MKRKRISGKKMDRDLTIFREDQLNRYLYNLNKDKLLDDDVYDKCIRVFGAHESSMRQP